MNLSSAFRALTRAPELYVTGHAGVGTVER